MTNSGAYPADFQAPKSLDGWGTQQSNSAGDVFRRLVRTNEPAAS